MRKIYLFFVCLALLLAQMSWAQTTVVYKDGVSTINGQPFFPKGIYTHNNNNVNFSNVAANGFNLVMSYYSKGGSNHQYILDQADAAGLKCLLYIGPDFVKNAQYSSIESIVNQFKDHNALYAWYLVDEPGPGYLCIDPARVKEAASRVKAADPNHPIFSSTWAVDATTDCSGATAGEYWDNVIDVDMRQAYYGTTWTMAENWKYGLNGMNTSYTDYIESKGKNFVSIINTHAVDFGSPQLYPNITDFVRHESPSPAEWRKDGSILGGINESNRVSVLNSNVGDPFGTSDGNNIPFTLSKMFPNSTDRVRGQIASSLAYGSLGTWSWLWQDPADNLAVVNDYYTVFHYDATKNSYKTIWGEVDKFGADLVAGSHQVDNLYHDSGYSYRYVKTSSGKEIVVVVNESDVEKSLTLSNLPSSATFTDLSTGQQSQLKTETFCVPASGGKFYVVGGVGGSDASTCGQDGAVGVSYEQNFESATVAGLESTSQASLNSELLTVITNSSQVISGSKSLLIDASGQSGWKEGFHSPVGNLIANKKYSISYSLNALSLGGSSKYYVLARSASRANGVPADVDYTEFEQSIGTTQHRTFNFTAGASDDYYFIIGVYNGGSLVIDNVEISGAIVGINPTSVSLNTSSFSLAGGAQQTLTATVLPSDASNKTVNWSSSNESVATVVNGTVTGLTIGSTTITATTVTGGLTASATVNVTSSVPVSSVSVSPTSFTLVSVGQTRSVSATISPSNAGDKSVSWSSSNSSVATVSNGVVTAVSNGSATITATSNNNGSIKANCAVTVDINTSISKPGFGLVWNEEFDQTTGLDKSSWSHNLQWTAGRSLNAANEEQAYRSDLAVVANGELTITQEKLATAYSYGGKDYNYASGAIQSKALRTIKYGYIEMRAKMPNNGGTWPAFWLMPNHNNTYAPYGTEIDIMEYFRNHNQNGFNFGLFSNGYKDNEGDGWKAVPGSPYTITVGDKLSDAYHTYGLEWTPTELICFYDGVEVARYSSTTVANKAFGSVIPEPGEMIPIGDHYIILNVAMSDNSDYSGPIVDSDLVPSKVSMNVDYVRYYEHDDCAAIQTLEDERLGHIGKNRLTFENDNLTEVVSAAAVPMNSSILSVTDVKWSDHLVNNNTGYEQQTVDYSFFNVISGDKSVVVENSASSEQVAYSTPTGLFKANTSYTFYLNYSNYIGSQARLEVRDLSSGGTGTVVSGLTNTNPKGEWQFNYKMTFTPTNNNYAVVLVAKGGQSFVYDEVIIVGDVNGNIGALSSTNLCGAISSATGLDVSPSSVTMNPGQTFVLTGAVIPSNVADKGVNWSSSNASVASVHPTNGTVTANAVGSVTITGSSNDGGHEASSAITVTNNAIIVTGISVSPSSLALFEGGSGNLTATITPALASNQTVTWLTSDTNVVTVSGGVVTPISVGTATITARSNNGLTSTSNVTVSLPPAPATVDFETTENTSFDSNLSDGLIENRYITGFGTQTFRGQEYASQTGLFLPDVPYTISYDLQYGWANGSATFYTLLRSASGGADVGRKEYSTSTLTAGSVVNMSFDVTTGSSSDYYMVFGLDATDGSFDLDNISIGYGDAAPTVYVTGVSLSPSNVPLTVGGTYNLTETVSPSNATNKNVTWESSASGIASVNNGIVTAIAAGTATITTRTVDGAFSATSSVTVTSGPTVDPDFHIYLAFGQSNMEGQGAIEAVDQTVNSRFQVLSAVTCDARTEGTWYDAIPPLSRCGSGLSPADYFGRTLVDGLASNIRVGIINVSLGGAKIELFDKGTYAAYKVELENANNADADWMLSVINGDYNGNPYQHLVDMAQVAQQTGVIKGIIMHQGESNWGETTWPAKVKGVYDDLITDLGLSAAATPFLVGEIVDEAYNSGSANMNNNIISTIPDIIPNAYVISSSGITMKNEDPILHFDAAGLREFGARYGDKMLALINGETEPEATAITIDSPVDGATFASGATVNVTASANGTLSYIGINADGAYSTQDNSSPYTTLPVADLADGSHVLTAFSEVPENSGNWIGSNVINITIGGGTPIVDVTGVTVNPTSLPLTVAGTSTLVETVSPSNADNKDVTWTSSAPAIASVNNGLVTALTAGTATITVETVDGKFTASSVVTVSDGGSGGASIVDGTYKIEFVSNSEALLLTGTGAGSDAQTAAYTDVATKQWDITDLGDGSYKLLLTTTGTGLKANGTADGSNVYSWQYIGADDEKWSITDVGNGQYTLSPKNSSLVIQAMSDNNVELWTSDGATDQKVTITSLSATTVGVTGVTVNPTSLSLTLDETSTLVETVSPSNATNKNVQWTSSAPGIASVGINSGIVTALTAGTATITATTDDGGKTATSVVTVNSVVTFPAPWSSQDIGAVGAIGSASFSNGTFTMSGSGADIWNSVDEFHYVSQSYSGDVEVTARVNSLTNSNAWTKAGVMIRGSLDANSQHAMTVITPSNGVNLQARATAGSSTMYTQVTGQTAPSWVRVKKEGSSLTSYYSTDGIGWTQIGSVQTINMGSSFYVGMCITSHVDGTLATAEIDNVSVNGTSTIPVTGVTVNPTSLSLTVNETSTLVETVSPSNATDKNVQWTSSAPGIASVGINSGIVTALTAGTVTITATTDDGGKTATSSVTVTAAPTSDTNIALNKTATQSSQYSGIPASDAVDGTTSTFNHTLSEAEAWLLVDLGSVSSITSINVYNREGQLARMDNFHVLVSDVAFTSTDLSNTINQSGVSDYHTTGQGGLPTTHSVNRSGRYVRVQLTNTNFLHVTELEVMGTEGGGSSTVYVTGVSVSPTSLSLTVDETSTLVETVSPSNATDKNVSWTSSTPSIASVDINSGLVTAVTAGSATITVTTDDGSKTATSSVTVSNPSSGGGSVVVYNNTTSTVNGNVFFVRGIYSGKSANEIQWAKMKTVGFNVVQNYPQGKGTDDNTQLYLDAAEANGMMFLLQIDRDLLIGGTSNLSTVATTVNRFKNHPALYGWYLIDEPSSGAVAEQVSASVVKAFKDQIKSLDSNHPVFASNWDVADYSQAQDVDMRQMYQGSATKMNTTDWSGDWKTEIDNTGLGWTCILNSHTSKFGMPKNHDYVDHTSPGNYFKDSNGITKNSTSSEYLYAIARAENLVTNHLNDPFGKNDHTGVEYKMTDNFPENLDRIRGAVASALAHGSNAIYYWLWENDDSINSRWGWYTVWHYTPTKNGIQDVLTETNHFDELLIGSKSQDQKWKIGNVFLRYVKASNGKEVIIAVNESLSSQTINITGLPGSPSATFKNVQTGASINITNTSITIPADGGLFLTQGTTTGTGPGGGVGGTTGGAGGGGALPTLTLTSPSNGDTFASGSTVTFTATTTDASAAYVSIKSATNSNLATDTSSPYSINVTGLADGDHEVWAFSEKDGTFYESAKITITIGGSSGGGGSSSSYSMDFNSPATTDGVKSAGAQTIATDLSAKTAIISGSNAVNTTPGWRSNSMQLASEWNEFYYSPSSKFSASTGYTISFEYKILNNGDNGILYAVAKSSAGGSDKGWNQVAISSGGTGTMTSTFTVGAYNDYYLVIGMTNKAKVVIDNVTITPNSSARMLSDQNSILDESLTEREINIYPNPVSDARALSIDYEAGAESKQLNILLYDNTGRIVINQMFNVSQGDNKLELDLSKLSRGLFYIRLISGESKYADKLLIE